MSIFIQVENSVALLNNLIRAYNPQREGYCRDQ